MSTHSSSFLERWHVLVNNKLSLLHSKGIYLYQVSYDRPSLLASESTPIIHCYKLDQKDSIDRSLDCNTFNKFALARMFSNVCSILRELLGTG